MKTDIWMPVYVGDYLADTLHLSVAEHGAYFLLMLHYWRKGPLTGNMSRLLSITKIPTEKSAILVGILEEFFTYNKEENKWYHSRIESELGKADSRREASRVNGLKGGRPLGSTHNLDNLEKTQRITNSFSLGEPRNNPEHNRNHNLEKSSSPSPSPLPLTLERREKEILRKSQAEKDFETFYEAYPKHKGRKDALKAFTTLYSELPEIDELVVITKKFAKSDDCKKDNGQFIPYPATWLRKGMWDDEILEPAETEDERRRRIISAI